jgi:Domain of unknown function (DUF3846)
MKQETIKIVRKEVRKEAEVVEIPNTLESLQGEVGGWIETVHVGSGIVMICNEEGKFNGSEANFHMGMDVIMGNVIFVGTEGEEFASLNEEELEAVLDWLG